MEPKLSKTCVPVQRSSKMSEDEIQALCILAAEARNIIEPFTVLQILKRYGSVHQSAFIYLLHMFRSKSREEICELLLHNIHYYCSFSDVVHALFCSGNGCYGKRLLDILQEIHLESNIWKVYRTQCGNREKINLFFKDIKRMVHDATFDNPRKDLRGLAERFRIKLGAATVEKQKQVIADKYIALLGAEIDAHAITFDDHLSEHDLFQELDGLTVESSNTVLTNVIYFGRLANANAIAGNFHNCKDMLRTAQSYATFCGPSLELANMHYIDVYVKLWEYETNPNETLQKELIRAGWFGLCNLENETNESIKQLWRRMFILRMVFCLLGIGNRANVFLRGPVPWECIEEARKLLLKIDEMWDGIETRREMFYYVARSRLCELTNEITFAIEYIITARKCAIDGHFKELQFINTYKQKLQEQHATDEMKNARPQITVVPEVDSNAKQVSCVSGYSLQAHPAYNARHEETVMEKIRKKNNGDVSFFDKSITGINRRVLLEDGTTSNRQQDSSITILKEQDWRIIGNISQNDTMGVDLPSDGHITLPSVTYRKQELYFGHSLATNSYDDDSNDSITQLKEYSHTFEDQMHNQTVLDQKEQESAVQDTITSQVNNHQSFKRVDVDDSMACNLPSDSEITFPSVMPDLGKRLQNRGLVANKNSAEVKVEKIVTTCIESQLQDETAWNKRCCQENLAISKTSREQFDNISSSSISDIDSMGCNLPSDGHISSLPKQTSQDTQEEAHKIKLFLNQRRRKDMKHQEVQCNFEQTESSSMEGKLPSDGYISPLPEYTAQTKQEYGDSYSHVLPSSRERNCMRNQNNQTPGTNFEQANCNSSELELPSNCNLTLSSFQNK